MLIVRMENAECSETGKKSRCSIAIELSRKANFLITSNSRTQLSALAQQNKKGSTATMRASSRRKSQSVDGLILQAAVTRRNSRCTKSHDNLAKLAEYYSRPIHRTSEHMELVCALPCPPLLERSDDSSDDGSQLRPKIMVSFCSHPDQLHVVPRRTAAEMRDSFFSSQEFERINNDNHDTIQDMQRKMENPPTKKNDCSYRGLEIPRAKYEREQRTKFVVKKILQEQEKSKTLSPKWVQKFSQRFSSQTARAARYLGRVDEKAAASSICKSHE